MPPFVPRRREQSPPAKPKLHRPKASLFAAADAPTSQVKSAEETRTFLDSLDSDESSLSEVESDEFEDVPPAKKRKLDQAVDEHSENGDDDEMDWEDAMGDDITATSLPRADDQLDIQDISVTINDDGTYVEPDLQERMFNAKKGPTKRERQIRNLTHCLHVQSLLWHNTVRNSWLNDKAVQKSLMDAIPEGVKREITRWREAMGILTKEELDAKKKQAPAKNKGKKGRRSTEKGRDWSYEAKHSQQGVPNLSAGDPLLRLLKVLTAYWRKRFTITAPAFRKRGYMPLRRLRQEIKDWEKNSADAEEHGERIENIQAFRELAKKCEGSRDVGGQLFVALLRGIGLDTRMVANLQPAGIGWSKAEEADAKKPKNKVARAETPQGEPEPEKTWKPANKGSARKPQPNVKTEKPTRKSTRGNMAEPISVDDSDESLSDPPSETEDEAPLDEDDDDDLSVIDVTPNLPKRKPSKKYDRDLAFPTYWTEVCSPVSHKFIPVDPIVLSTIASNDELLQTFEPRGKKAELAKQVICYVTAFYSDGTAKDVTVRYLKKHQLPGKTKGMRMPAEKIAIYNKRGKVRRYEEHDWFRTVMALYDRPEGKRTPADDLEDQTDLKPFKPQKEGKEVEKESLQWYKQSAEFVLEQHLRREEAIIPGAEPVKTFTAGKGDKSKDHDVYRREDVVTCKTVESWHKEGRAIKEGEQPVKHVPMRAVTLIKKREIEEAERETGEKMKQGLYARGQTDWIIPPPIENGVIPKNAYGNMDVYVETMVPKGAVHLKLKGSAKICRNLGIDYAEACTGFEFGKQRAVPVLTGVVVAKEHAQMVRDSWRAAQEEIKRKEDTKRTNTSLNWWRKMLMGMRIVERMRVEYENAGAVEEEVNPFVSRAKREGRESNQFHDAADGNGGGGFLLPGEEELPHSLASGAALDDDLDVGGGFLPQSDDEDLGASDDGGVLVEENPEDGQPSRASTHTPVTPVSLQSVHNVSGNGYNGHHCPDEDMDNTPISVPIESFGRAGPTNPTNKSKPSTMKTTAITKGHKKAKSSPPTPESDAESDSLPEPPEPPKTASARRKPRAAKKALPTKSPYFLTDDDDDDTLSSEQEVIKPKRTTARTRKSG